MDRDEFYTDEDFEDYKKNVPGAHVKVRPGAVERDNIRQKNKEIKDLEIEIELCEHLKEPNGYYTAKNFELFNNQITIMKALKLIMEKRN